MISVQCPKCKRSANLPDAAAGKTARCKCGVLFTVPAAPVAANDAEPPPQPIQRVGGMQQPASRAQALPIEPKEQEVTQEKLEKDEKVAKPSTPTFDKMLVWGFWCGIGGFILGLFLALKFDDGRFGGFSSKPFLSKTGAVLCGLALLDLASVAVAFVLQRTFKFLSFSNKEAPRERVGIVIALAIGIFWILGTLSGGGKKGTSSGGTTQDVAVRFVENWVSSGSNAAASQLDSRALDAARTFIQTWKLNRFDGKISSLGEKSYTELATGNQIACQLFLVTPVVDMGGSFMPISMTISVTTDSKKVFLVQPDL